MTSVSTTVTSPLSRTVKETPPNSQKGEPSDTHSETAHSSFAETQTSPRQEVSHFRPETTLAGYDTEKADNTDVESNTSDDDNLQPTYSDAVQKHIQLLLRRRDAYWRERLEIARESQVCVAVADARRSVTKKFAEILERERDQYNTLKTKYVDLKHDMEEKEQELIRLKKELAAMETELHAGKAIVHQFSQLMNDKASSVCRFCRRSGTLPPLPFR